VSVLAPAAALVMPFDVSAEKVSFQLVSQVGGRAAVATHWAYWAADGRHLLDVLVCLTPNDTKVMDAEAIQGEMQLAGVNEPTGVVGDLRGERGIVVVTVYDVESQSAAGSCRPRDPVAPTTDSALIGSWTIADPDSNAAFGSDAIGLTPDALPDATHLAAGLWIPTFDPESLDDSEVILIGLQTRAGSGPFADSELGPIDGILPNGAHVCCDVAFVDTLENRLSLPSICFTGVGFGTMKGDGIAENETALLASSTTIGTSGALQITHCVTAGTGGRPAALGRHRPQFLFAFHGQAVGPYGIAVSGKYPP
jgi:hypothetical protein